MSPRRKFYKHLIGWSALAMVILLPVSHFLWGAWAGYRLKKTLAALHAAGEPVVSHDLKRGAIPDFENASLDYLAAGDSIDPATPAWKTFDQALRGSFRLPLTDSELATVREIVSSNPAALARVANARGKKAGDWEDPFEDPDITTVLHFNGSRQLANLLHLAAFDAHANGDDLKALQYLTDIMAESEAAEHRPTVVGHLVAIGIDAMASDAISSLAPEIHVDQNPKLQNILRSMIQVLQDESGIDAGIKYSWRTERIASINTMRKVADGTLASPGSPGSGAAAPSSGISGGYVMRPMVLTDVRLYANYLQGVMQAETAPDWPAAQRRMPTDAPAIIQAHPMMHLLISILLPSVQHVGRWDYRARSQRRMAAVALAVRLYAADHNQELPNALADLVPAYLPSIPIDAMTGSSIRYKPDPPRIYCLDEEGIDHGGVPPDYDTPGKRHGDIVVYLQTQPRK